MSSPGGREVGRVSIRVTPDTAGFRRDLQREIEAVENSLKVTIPVDFDVDTGGLQAQLQAVRAALTVPVGFDLDDARLQAQLRALESARISIPVDLDIDAANLVALEGALQGIGNQTVRVDVDTAAAVADLEALEQVLRTGSTAATSA